VLRVTDILYVAAPPPGQRYNSSAAPDRVGGSSRWLSTAPPLLHRRSTPRLSRGSSASGDVEHGAEVLLDAVASAAKRGEAFPLSPLQRWQREAHERRVTISEQAADAVLACALYTLYSCALPPLAPRLS
jgi:hypothetical protein